MSSSALENIHKRLNKRQLKKDEILFNIGDKGDELIIVNTGQIAIFAPGPNGSQHIIRFFQNGENLGEITLIDEKPRSLNAKAMVEAEILTLSKTVILELISGKDTMIALEIMRELSARIRCATNLLKEVKDWVQIIAEG